MQLIPSLTVGGAERMVATLARHLQASGHDVTVVSMYAPRGTWIEEELRAAAVPQRFLGKRAGLDARMFARVARAIHQLAPDVVHTHMYALKYALPALMLRPRCRIVHTVHTVASAELDRWSMAVQWVAYRAGVIPVGVGDAVTGSIRSSYGCSSARTIPNGIPVAAFAGSPGARRALRASEGIPPDAPTFVAVGALNEAKNHAALLAAFAVVRRHVRDAHLLLAGDGELRRGLEDRSRELGLEGAVHFLGVRSDVGDVLAAADVFVLPSRWEGNPLSVMEAMAAGRPIVATAVGCLPEIVPPGAGRLVTPGDDGALAAALRELATDLGLARAMGAAAARVARARFDAATMARSYEELYARTA